LPAAGAIRIHVDVADRSRLVVKSSNYQDTREGWLRAAANELRPFFERCGYQLPENIRFAIAFPSTGRKGKRVGECWHSSTSADSAYEIFIRADLSEPEQVLGVLLKELVHTLLPPDAGHGKMFKTAATRIGLEGPMRQATPGPLLRERLQTLAAALGPLPHAELYIDRQPMSIRGSIGVDVPKKQSTRYRKAVCTEKDCPYTVRVASSHVINIGPPHCPRHGAMAVDLLSDDEKDEEQAEAAA
jgi:hypothetical protein